MSGWQELRAERNRRSVLRLTKALPLDISTSRTIPCSCPSLHSTDAAACNRVHTGVLIQFVPIAWREHSQLAAKRPMDGLGSSGTAGATCLSRSARHLRRTARATTHWVQDSAACVVSLSTAWAGTLTFGRAVPTRMRCGTALAWSPGSSGMRPNSQIQLLRRIQSRRCAQSGGRLWRNAEVDHCVPLFRVWSEHRDTSWPRLLDFWGLPNLQVINRDIHAAKCATEARDRASRALSRLQPPNRAEARALQDD